ncbi:MAG TPA: XRE family transcriptional regulator [Ilumatobacteraceae bacterium]|nr:XRE family transcriptional regulator [Ilumatobacteraceae bacterium]HRB03505.1 XRE family transcriptional regulator [Ilumatobacteraceae bacterium]
MTPRQKPAAQEAALEWQELGRAVRERRLASGLTLVGLAARVGLSQPFLSQVENGRARPSLVSLHRIAEALGSTPQALFAGTTDIDAGAVVVRADDVRMVDVESREPAESACHMLLAGDAPFRLLEFDGLPSEFIEYFAHDGFEATYVISGRVQIDVAGEITDLGPGDSISYPARLPHRLRALGKRRASILMIETKVEATKPNAVAKQTNEPNPTKRSKRSAIGPSK